MLNVFAFAGAVAAGAVELDALSSYPEPDLLIAQPLKDAVPPFAVEVLPPEQLRVPLPGLWAVAMASVTTSVLSLARVLPSASSRTTEALKVLPFPVASNV
jgi:hypothetical protein